MDYCTFVKRSDAKIEGRPSGSVTGRWRRRLAGGCIDAFTLIELLIMVVILGILSGIAVPIYADFRYQAQVTTAKGIIREIESGINMYYYKYGTYPTTLSDAMTATPLDPWGNTYVYHSSAEPNWSGIQRFDRNLRPLNSDFDLYSVGLDGRTAPGLSDSASADDVVRAGNGWFVDLGALY